VTEVVNISETADNQVAAASDASTADSKLPFFVTEEFAKLFELGEVVLHSNGVPARTIHYCCFQPVDANAREKLPLIVWMHGHGDDELKRSKVGQLKHIRELVFGDVTDATKFRFCLLAVRCPVNEPWTSPLQCDECPDVCDAAEVTVHIVNRLVEQLPVDRDRIYLVGLSSGGTASWEMARRHPHLFAAVAPLASAGAGDRDLTLLRDVPIWTFHVTTDPMVDVELVRDTVRRLQQIGGSCALTETSDEPHDCWGAAFFKYGLLDWLFAQRRGATDAPPPGQSNSYREHLDAQRIARGAAQYWPQTLVALGVVAVLWLVRRERRKIVAARSPRDPPPAGEP
jgi:predicted esterase